MSLKGMPKAGLRSDRLHAAFAGADIDAVGFVFLQNISAGTLYDVQYSGIPTDQASFSLATSLVHANGIMRPHSASCIASAYASLIQSLDQTMLSTCTGRLV